MADRVNSGGERGKKQFEKRISGVKPKPGCRREKEGRDWRKEEEEEDGERERRYVRREETAGRRGRAKSTFRYIKNR